MAAKKRKRVEESAVVKDRAVRFLFTKSFSTAARPPSAGRRFARARAAPRESASSGAGADRRVRVVGRVRVLTDAHTTDERPARASEGRTPPPPPPLRGARGARSRALRFRFGREGSVAAAASRRPSPSPRARRKAPRTSARARPVDDRETPLSTRSFRAQEGHSLSLSRGAPPSRRAEGGSARRRRAPRLKRRGLEPRASGLSGGAPIALSRARSSRVFSRRGANRLEANAPPRRAAAPETKRNASRGGDSVGLVEPRSLLAEAIPHSEA